MTPLRCAVLKARTRLSRPWRRRRLDRLASVGLAPISAVFYHRVADSHPNPWTLSNPEFAAHIEYMRARFELISLAEVQLRVATRSSDRPAAAITFDDGYAENCHQAIPLLIRHRIPCTYFVTLEHLLSGAPFAHDVAAGQPLPINTLDEVRAMSDAGVEIGLHCRTHIDLAGVTCGRTLRREIVDAAAELADLVGRPIRYFAFPFGMPAQLTPQAIEAIEQAGLQGFCSAYGAYNLPGQDSFHIRRFHGDRQFARLENWLTFDTAKLRKPVTLSYRGRRNAADPAARDSSVGGAPPDATGRRPLRVMFVITSMPVGGAETLLVNLLDGFDRRRIDPQVVCLKEPGPLGEAIVDRVTLHSHLTRGKYDLGVLPRLARLMARERIDAVITVGAGDKMFWGRLAARLAGVPVVCSALHSTGWPDGLGRLNRILTRWTDGFIAVADDHRRHLVDVERLPAESVHVIRNGVDCERFRPSGSACQDVAGRLGLAAGTPLIGIVAALREEKNHEMFVDVAAELSRRGHPAHYLIIGDGPRRELIRRRIEACGLSQRVHLLGTRQDTAALLAALDVFLLCSHNEASPVSILEALACQVPVVSTRVGSIAETVRLGQTGYLVPPGDTAAMVQRVEALLADAGERARLGAAGRSWVLRTGSLQSMLRGYTDLIERLYDARVQRLASWLGDAAQEPASTATAKTLDLEAIWKSAHPDPAVVGVGGEED